MFTARGEMRDFVRGFHSIFPSRERCPLAKADTRIVLYRDNPWDIEYMTTPSVGTTKRRGEESDKSPFIGAKEELGDLLVGQEDPGTSQPIPKGSLDDPS